MSRVPVPTQQAFSTRVRGERLSARVGTWLGVCFGLCFLTGLVSHWYYLADAVVLPPARPVWAYRVTQGVHVLSGIAAIPLLLVKLWSVYPRLFAAVPWRPTRALVVHLAERASIAVLVATAIFQLATGLANITQWYPWSFSFRATHYALAWTVVGALLLHVAVKLPAIRRAYAEPLGAADREVQPGVRGPAPDRRTVLRVSVLASAVAVLAAAGSSVPALRRVSVFAVRSGEGPQGVPINTSAQAAGVVEAATDPAYRLTVAHGGREVTLDRDQLEQMAQRVHELPIACVEGWSASGRWTGVRLVDLLDLVEGPAGAAVRVRSLQQQGPFRVVEVPARFARDPLTLLALGLGGEPLTVDHGYPCRLIAPNLPGVLQTKWVARIEVVT